MTTGARYRLVRGDGTSWTVSEGGHLSIGRSKRNDVRLADSTVSRRHATLMVSHGRCWIRDEGSAHGTFVNGRRVPGQQELRPGDTLRIGQDSFGLQSVTLPSSAPQAAVPERRRRQVLWGVGSAAVVILVLAIALAGQRGSSPVDRTPTGSSGDSRVASGPVEVDHDGTAQMELHDGSQTTVHFVGRRGEPVDDLQANYVSDAAGVTVIAVPQDGEYYPTIQFFPSAQAGRVSPGMAAPAYQGLDAITIDLESVVFDESIHFQRTLVSIDHLNRLPSNMPDWEATHLTRDDICGPLTWGLTGAHVLIAAVHASVSPPSGVPHAVAAVVMHAPVEAACEAVLRSNPATEYVGWLNSQLEFGIVWPEYEGVDSGIVLGQVVDDETDDGIAGADVSLDGSISLAHTFTTLSNGWYVFALPPGQQAIWAEAPGYISTRMDITVEAGKAQEADAIPLIPDATTQSLRTGDVKVTLRWNTTDDLDLLVTDPQGDTIYWGSPRSRSGGVLDVDANRVCEDPTTSPVENIFWPEGQAPSGEYAVEVSYFEDCEAPGEVSYEVTILVDGRTASYSGTVESPDEVDSVTTFSR